MPKATHCLCQICGCAVPSDNQSDFYAQLSKWLDDHPEFTWNYFNQRACVPSESFSENTWHFDIHESSESAESSSSSRPSSTSVSVPMRKISSHDFDFPGYQRILSANADGKPTFMPPDFDTQIHSTATTDEPHRVRQTFTPSTPRFLTHHDSSPLCTEREFINELILDVCRELDITALCFKILQNVCMLVRADRGSLFLVDRDRVTGETVLVSKLFDVTPECILEDSLSHSMNRRIILPLGVGVSGHVAQTGEYANIPDAYADPRFTDVVDRETGYRTKCLLCMPIKNTDGTVLAVALIVNKRSPPTTTGHTNPSSNTAEVDDCFSDRDVLVFQSYVAFCGIGLHNAQIYQKSRLEVYRNQVLLELARIIFTEHSDLSRLIYTVMIHTVSLLQCQRSQILLVNGSDSLSNELECAAVRFSHVFNLTWSDCIDSTDWSKTDRSVDVLFPVQIELAKHVVRTGETINIPNAVADPRFDASMEENLDRIWRTQALLCMPIKHSDGHVLAVCFLINKCAQDWRARRTSIDLSSDPTLVQNITNWSCAFSNADECLFEAFALFAGLGISNRQMYDRVVRLVAKQRVLLDVLSYHATAPQSEAKWLANSLIPSVRFYQLDKFFFTDMNLTDESTLKASVRMFLEMRFMKTFKIDLLCLCRWILSVKKNYREVTYHNWRHAFNVAQTMFAVIMNAGIQDVFSDLECLAFMVACLSHDLDHRGTDNQFQVKTMSPLAELYSTSVLEHHHFNQCMMLLSRKGNDFLSSLSGSDYHHVINLIKENILATDLSRCFARLPDFNRTLQRRKSDLSYSRGSWEPWLSDTKERSLLGCMLMTTCDISAITKPWPVQKITAELVTAEFFEQGDLEKHRLHTQPKELMDRAHVNDLPNLQLSFIDSVCMPIYKAIVEVSEALQPLLDGCVRNRHCWVHLAEGREVPESLFGLCDSAFSSSEHSPTRSPLITHVGTMNASRIRQIVNAKPFESTTPARRTSTANATTVGGDVSCSSSTFTHQPMD